MYKRQVYDIKVSGHPYIHALPSVYAIEQGYFKCEDPDVYKRQEKGRAGEGAGRLNPPPGAFQVGIREFIKIVFHGK